MTVLKVIWNGVALVGCIWVGYLVVAALFGRPIGAFMRYLGAISVVLSTLRMVLVCIQDMVENKW